MNGFAGKASGEIWPSKGQLTVIIMSAKTLTACMRCVWALDRRSTELEGRGVLLDRQVPGECSGSSCLRCRMDGCWG